MVGSKSVRLPPKRIQEGYVVKASQFALVVDAVTVDAAGPPTTLELELVAVPDESVAELVRRPCFFFLFVLGCPLPWVCIRLSHQTWFGDGLSLVNTRIG